MCCLLRCIGRDWHIAAFAATQHLGRDWTNKGQTSILARDGYDVNDPKQTLGEGIRLVSTLVNSVLGVSSRYHIWQKLISSSH